MRYFLGCDVCKSKIDVALVSEQGAVLWTDKVPNDTVELIAYLLTISDHHLGDEIICIAEDTSIYHHPLLAACHKVGMPCRTYNPILTRQGIKGSIRGKKTDKSDAILVARMGIRGEGRVNMPEPYKTTRYAARAQQRLGDLSGAVKRYQRHVEEVLAGDLSNEAKELLEAIQTQFALARKQFVVDTARSAPPDLMRKLQTVPGVGPYIAASIIGEIQDMARFHTSKQLIAYAGLDPKIKQSGHSLNKTGRLTKRGSAYLRRSLFIAASIARRYDPYFKALYDKKRDEGKTYKVAVCVVARRLLAVVRAVWLGEKDYCATLWPQA